MQISLIEKMSKLMRTLSEIEITRYMRNEQKSIIAVRVYKYLRKKKKLRQNPTATISKDVQLNMFESTKSAHSAIEHRG